MTTPLLEAAGVSKAFGGVQALRSMSIDVRRGEIHGLAGANGSGKSTFVKILAGVVQADAGRIRLGEREFAAHNLNHARIAHAAGIRFVHQDPGLFLDLSVADNFALTTHYETGLARRVRWDQLRRRTAEVLGRFDVHVDPRAPMRALRAADRTMVAIARALHDIEDSAGTLLVLDEPTAALAEEDVARLFESIRRCAARGQAIVLVNHRLREVLAVCDRVTVLRDGGDVATEATADLDEARLAELVVGRALDRRPRPRAAGGKHREPILELCGISGPGVHAADLVVARGEVVALAGLRGDGQTELLRMLFGDLPRRSGEIRFRGRPVHFRAPGEAINAGLAYVPANRADDAILPGQSVLANLLALGRPDAWRMVGRSGPTDRAEGEKLRRAFQIRLGSLLEPIANLSGGNQQKVVFGRWFRRQPLLLLLDEPGQGVDIGAHSEIEALIGQAAADGTGVLLVSSDLGEICRLADRALVMRSGRIVGELAGPVDETELLHLMLAPDASAAA